MAQHPHIWVLLPRPVVLIVEENAEVPAILRIHLEQEFGNEHVVDTLLTSLGAENEPAIFEVILPERDGDELSSAIESTPDATSVAAIRLVPMAAAGDAVLALRNEIVRGVARSSVASFLSQLDRGLTDRSPRIRGGRTRARRTEPSGVAKQSDDEALLGRVNAEIEASMSDSRFTIDRLADSVGLSSRQLERRLRDICGESPSGLVRRLRFSRARDLLQADAGSVSEIMFSVGYRSSSNFAAAFRRMFGMSPSDCRKSCRLS